MVTATKVMNLVSGVIILLTGIYVQLELNDLLPAAIRILLGIAALGYFFIQLQRYAVIDVSTQSCTQSGCETELI